MSNDLPAPVADQRDAVIQETAAAILYRCREGG